MNSYRIPSSTENSYPSGFNIVSGCVLVGVFEAISLLDGDGNNLIAHELDVMLPDFRHFSRSKTRHLYRYIVGLIHPSNMNLKSVSAVSEEASSPCDQSSLNRFMNGNRTLVSGFNNSRIFGMARSGIERYMLIDDTLLVHPYGDNIEGVGTYWDAAEKRWIQGHNVVTSMAVTEKEVEPLDVGVYLKKDQAATSKVVFHTKIEIAVEMIRARASMLKLRGVIFDCWYLCEKTMNACETLGLHWYSDLRTNRIVYLPGNDKRFNVLELAKSLPDSAFRQVKLPDSWNRYTRMAEMIVILKGKKTKARNVKLCILWDGKEDSESYKFLATNDLSADGVKQVELRRLRWKIEEFHRDAKQNLGMTDCMLRKYDGVVIHLLLVLQAYSVLKRLLASALNTVVTTVGEACRYLKRQALSARYSGHTGT
jgi:hypothetical protein